MPSGRGMESKNARSNSEPLAWAAILTTLASTMTGLSACQVDAGSAQEETPREGQIVGRATVTDGDTIEIRSERIRLWGIDAPESTQQCIGPSDAREPAGRRAAMALSDMIGTLTVICTERDRDQYNRAVSVCEVDGQDLSRAMADQSWAWAFVRYSGDYIGQEVNAREARRGVWAWACQVPWEYRAERRRS